MEKYLEAGKVINIHGVDGMVKFDPWCDSPQVAASLETLYYKKDGEFLPVRLTRTSVYKGMVLMKLEGCDSIDDASKLKNKVLYCDRDDIPLEEGSFFIADVKGLDVIDADTGEVYGKVEDITNHGASDLYEVKRPWGDTDYVPAVNEFIDRVELDKGVYIHVIEGLMSRKPEDENDVPSECANAEKADNK